MRRREWCELSDDSVGEDCGQRFPGLQMSLAIDELQTHLFKGVQGSDPVSRSH
jgi:hypothetical protein